MLGYALLRVVPAFVALEKGINLIMISSRVNDPRVAEQLSAIVIVPILALFFGQISGFLVIDSRIILIMIAILILIDLGMLYLTERLFQRETILTRWK